MSRLFADFARRPEPRLDLLEGALLIAREEYPNLDIRAYRNATEALARRARRYVGRVWPPERKSALKLRAALHHLNEFLFGRVGFRGNDDDYYDPRNSYLNEVLDRKLGIPITLSIIYWEVARRVDLPVTGVGFPGRYLVKGRAGGRDIYVDCFDGRMLDVEECRDLLASLYGDKLELTEEMLRPASRRDTLARVLNNLKGIYLGRGDFDRVERVLRLSEDLTPGAPDHLRDRGLILIQREEFGRGLEALEAYLRQAPDAPDATVIRSHVQMTRRLLTHLN